MLFFLLLSPIFSVTMLTALDTSLSLVTFIGIIVKRSDAMETSCIAPSDEGLSTHANTVAPIASRRVASSSPNPESHPEMKINIYYYLFFN